MPKAWRSRGYLPHYDEPHLFQMLTFRLCDSLPAHRLAELSDPRNEAERREHRRMLEDLLDAGAGACHLRDARVARLAEDSLLHFDEERYRLLAWVVMPNHLHVLVQFLHGHPMDKVLHSWKSYIANQANKLLCRSGVFWQREYFDRFIRNEQHYLNAVAYIEYNPVKAGLAERAEDFPHSSARLRIGGYLP